MHTETDLCGTLLLEIQRGQEQAFHRLYENCSDTLLLVLLRRHPNRARAERALHQLFTQVWVQCHLYDPDQGSGMSWLSGLVRDQPSAPRKTPSPAEVAEPGRSSEAFDQL